MARAHSTNSKGIATLLPDILPTGTLPCQYSSTDQPRPVPQTSHEGCTQAPLDLCCTTSREHRLQSSATSSPRHAIVRSKTIDRALPSRISAQVGGRRVLTHAAACTLRYSVLNAGPVRVQLCSGTWRRGHLHRVASALHQTRWRCSCSSVAAERCCEWGCPQCCQRHLEPTWPGRRRVARRCSSSGWHSPRRLSSHSTR